MSRAVMEQARDALALCRLNGSRFLYGPERDVVFSALAALDAALAEQAQPEQPRLKQTFTRSELLRAIEAERHACSIAVWMTLQQALAPDADELGLDGWMREAEASIKRRSANDPETTTPAPQPLTDEDIAECLPLGIALYSTIVGKAEIGRFARAVEAEVLKRMGGAAMSRAAMEQALEALASLLDDAKLVSNGLLATSALTTYMADAEAAIAALRAALAEPELRNQCGETCERAKLCAVCAQGLTEQSLEVPR